MVDSVIDVVLPVLNEAAVISRVVQSLPTGYRAIVVDIGSTDDSPVVAHATCAVVASEPQRGFGAACFAGLVGPPAKSDSWIVMVRSTASTGPLWSAALIAMDTPQVTRLVDARPVASPIRASSFARAVGDLARPLTSVDI